MQAALLNAPAEPPRPTVPPMFVERKKLVAKKVSDNAVRAQYNMLLVKKVQSDVQVEQSNLELAKATMQLEALKMCTAQVSAPETAASYAQSINTDVGPLANLDAIDLEQCDGDADVDGEFDGFFQW
jgi:hypothetical protein